MKIGQTISRRALLSHAAAMAAVAATPAWAAEPNPVVVELFTSQGCSSCPPADALLTELRARPGVVALTYHVDYWDYLGWKDTLGDPAFSQRQYDYAKARGDMNVYTPQIIIDGGAHFSGADRASVLAALAAPAPAGPALHLNGEEGALRAAIAAGAAAEEATLWLLPVVAAVEVTIGKGENAGKTLRYCNVVRDVVPAGMWSGAAGEVLLPRESLMAESSTGCVALLQTGKAGAVLASASWGQLA